VNPPPLPQASRKRILPALLLCLVLCAHRIYAGRIASGLAQIAWLAGAFLWLKATCAGLVEIVRSGPMDLDTIERISDWEQAHGVPVAPMLALIGAGVWIAVDAARLIAGRFTDGRGNKITKWT
jgi:TM2 domain-containing membrane protein YozV